MNRLALCISATMIPMNRLTLCVSAIALLSGCSRPTPAGKIEGPTGETPVATPPLVPLALVHPTPPPFPPKVLHVPTQEQVQEMAGWLESKPSSFTPPASDRKTWENAPLDRDGILNAAQKWLKTPIPPLTDELYLDFGKTGRRDPFQTPFQQRLQRMAALALAECVEFQGHYLPPLREVLEEILAEKSWVLPAHDAKVGYAAFRGEMLYIDLGVAARIAAIATVYQWLGPQLGEEQCERIRSEISRRAITPYLDYIGKEQKPSARSARVFNWITAQNNWNAVCHGGLVYATLATVDDPMIRARVAAATRLNIENYLNGFTPDGYCSEGLGYWNYGFRHFVVLAETLARATSAKVDLYGHPFIEAIASYPFRLETAPNLYPAFADSSPNGKPGRSLLKLLARRVDLSAIPGALFMEEERLATEPSLYQMDLVISPPAVPPGSKVAIKGLPASHRGFFPDAGILVCRPPTPARGLAVGMKGGNNNEHHNHNDVGSYMVASNGLPVLVDPGAEKYTARTFSPRRYESTVINSYGHPVPVIDGQLQSTGSGAAGRIVEAAFSDACDRLVLDLTSAYPVSGLNQAKRTFFYHRSGKTGFEVLDEIQLSRDAEIETAVITFGQCQRRSESQWIIRDGKGGVLLTIDTGGVPFEIREEELTEELLSGRKARRLGIRLRNPARQARIHLSMEPIDSSLE